MALPSGLPESVADEEPIIRFLTSSRHFSTVAVKPVAFMPNPKDGLLSVARHGGDPLGEAERVAKEDFRLPKVHGFGLLSAGEIREEELEVTPAEPPPRHADIAGWPWDERDKAFGKAQSKLIAAALAQKATRRLFGDV